MTSTPERLSQPKAQRTFIVPVCHIRVSVHFLKTNRSAFNIIPISTILISSGHVIWILPGKNESHMHFLPIQFQRQRQSSNGQRNYNDFQNINRQNRGKCHGKEVHGKVDRVGERCNAALAC